jgi:hypothetical protein
MRREPEKSYLEQKIEKSLGTAWITGLNAMKTLGPTDRTVRGKAGQVAPASRPLPPGHLALTLLLEEYRPPRTSKQTKYHEILLHKLPS